MKLVKLALLRGKIETARHQHNASVLSGQPLTMPERMRALEQREAAQSLTSEDIAAAIGGSDRIEPEEISSEEVSALFASEPNDNNNQGETEW